MSNTVRVLSILWWIGVIVAPFLVYWFVIRPKVKWEEIGAGLPPWERFKARVNAFATLVVTQVGALIVGLPDILHLWAGVDFSFLPQPWSAFASPAIMTTIVLIRGFKATPPQEPPSGEA